MYPQPNTVSCAWLVDRPLSNQGFGKIVAMIRKDKFQLNQVTQFRGQAGFRRGLETVITPSVIPLRHLAVTTPHLILIGTSRCGEVSSIYLYLHGSY